MTLAVMSSEQDDDWHLKAWAKHLGKKQADLVNELGWTSGRASKVWNSGIPYKREIVNEVASWLGIRPFELFMRPREAESLRRLRDTAREIASGDFEVE